jgi:Cdc6-like AAA superfamily ATPase
MTDSKEPTLTWCFRPDDYHTLQLFADREQEADLLGRALTNILAPGATGDGRILIRGDRGVGKSILTRKALDRVKLELAALFVEVDASHTPRGPEAFIRTLAEELAREAVQNVTDEELGNSAEILYRLSGATKVSVSTVQEWSRELKLGGSLKSGLADLVQLEFGLARATRRSRKVEESYERQIDQSFLGKLIQAFLTDCHRYDQKVVLFLDNLDQIGYAESVEDMTQIMNLAREVFGFRDSLVIANLRAEFVCGDLRKLYSQEFHVKGMTSEQLASVARKRIATSSNRPVLEEAGFEQIAQVLSRWTDNAWAYLNWLAFLDFQPIDFAPDDEEGLRRALRLFAEQRFAGLDPTQFEALARHFSPELESSCTMAELRNAGISQEQLDRALTFAALVPDRLPDPERFSLSPLLRFLVRSEN